MARFKVMRLFYILVALGFGSGLARTEENVATLEAIDSVKTGTTLHIRGEDVEGLKTEFAFETRMTNWNLIGVLTVSNNTEAPISLNLPVDFSFLARITSDKGQRYAFFFKYKNQEGQIEEGFIKACLPDTETLVVAPKTLVTRKIVIFLDLVFPLDPTVSYRMSLVTPNDPRHAWMKSAIAFRYTGAEVIYDEDETPFERIIKRQAQMRKRANN